MIICSPIAKYYSIWIMKSRKYQRRHTWFPNYDASAAKIRRLLGCSAKSTFSGDYCFTSQAESQTPKVQRLEAHSAQLGFRSTHPLLSQNNCCPRHPLTPVTKPQLESEGKGAETVYKNFVTQYIGVHIIHKYTHLQEAFQASSKQISCRRTVNSRQFFLGGGVSVARQVLHSCQSGRFCFGLTQLTMGSKEV